MNGNDPREINLTGPTNVPWLTPATWDAASTFDKVRHLGKDLSPNEKLTIMKEWIKPIAAKQALFAEHLEAVQDALREVTL